MHRAGLEMLYPKHLFLKELRHQISFLTLVSLTKLAPELLFVLNPLISICQTLLGNVCTWSI